MRTTLLSIFLFLGFITNSLVSKAQDNQDLGRKMNQEFEVFKAKGYQIVKLNSHQIGIDSYLAKLPNASNDFDNIINIDQHSGIVVQVIWNFSHKKFEKLSPSEEVHTPISHFTLLQAENAAQVIDEKPSQVNFDKNS